ATMRAVYVKGIGVEPDEAKGNEFFADAARLWAREADLGNAVALAYLADLALYGFEGGGLDVEADLDAAEEALRSAADAGCVGAFWRLGNIAEIVKEDLESAKKYYRVAAARGDAEADVRLALLEDAEGALDEADAFRRYQAAAAKGCAEAYYCLGRCYEVGFGCQENLGLAAECWRQSAERGDALAQNQYAEYLENLENPDWPRATALRIAAAEAGHAEAALATGFAYERGLGVEPDMAKAIEWYEIGAERGSLGAMCNLATCYEEGRGVERDGERACALYEKAAEGGWAPAKHALGVRCFLNPERPQDAAKTARLFADAAGQGYPPGAGAFSRCLFHGYGAPKNLVAAEFFLRVAADYESGAADALAQMYAEGNGLERDPECAAYWYEKSYALGNIAAARKLADYYWEGDGRPRDWDRAVELWKIAAQESSEAREALDRAAAALQIARSFACEEKNPENPE
ncbi:MAG: sel1 repeat family protein, partial [Thermoguttaceae bacterium]|nr:sel1 repeat family protein [Thermoguttaceae bacterium]